MAATSQISSAECAAALEWASPHPKFVALIKYLCSELLDGRNASITDGVTRALAQSLRHFSDYTTQSAAIHVWNGSPQS